MFNVKKVNNKTFIVSFKDEKRCAIKKLFPKETACSNFLAKLDVDSDLLDDGWVDLTRVNAFYGGMNITNMMNENCKDDLSDLYMQIIEEFSRPY